MNVRDEMAQYPPGQKITQMSRVDFQETVRLWMTDALDVEKLCQSSLKKDRTLAKKCLAISLMSADDIVALMNDDEWTRIEFKAQPGGMVDVLALRERWENARRL